MKRALMPLGAGGDAAAAAAAHRGPRAAAAVPLPPVIKSTMPPVVSVSIGLGEPGRRHHRAGAKALAAARAGVGDRLAARSEVLEIPGSRADFGHAIHPRLLAFPTGFEPVLP